MTGKWWMRPHNGTDPLCCHVNDERGGMLGAYPTDIPGMYRMVWWPFTGRRPDDIGPPEPLDDVTIAAAGDRWRAYIDGWPVRGPLDDEAETFISANRATWVLLYLLRAQRPASPAPPPPSDEQRERWRRIAARAAERADLVVVTRVDAT